MKWILILLLVSNLFAENHATEKAPPRSEVKPQSERNYAPSKAYPGFSVAIPLDPKNDGNAAACAAILIGKKGDRCAVAIGNGCMGTVQSNKGKVNWNEIKLSCLTHDNGFSAEGFATGKVSSSRSGNIKSGIMFVTFDGPQCAKLNNDVIMPIRSKPLRNNDTVKLGLREFYQQHTTKVVARYQKRPGAGVNIRFLTPRTRGVYVGEAAYTQGPNGRELAGFYGSGNLPLDTNTQLTWLRKQLANFNAAN